MTRTQPQQLRARRTRRQLLAAAKRVFARKGYDGATVDDICEAAHCSKGAYYFHFDSKEEAFLLLLKAWIGERSKALRIDHASEAGAVLGSSTGWPPALVLEFWARGARNEGVARMLRAATEDWRRLLRQRLRGEDVVDMALVLGSGMVMEAALGGRSLRAQDLFGELSRRAALRPTG